MNKILKELPNVFGIAEDILILGHDADGKEHDNNIEIFCKENLKLNKDKCHYRCMRVPFFTKKISRCSVQPDPNKLYVLTDMLP